MSTTETQSLPCPAPSGVPVEVHDIRSFDGTRLRCWVLGRGKPLVVVNPVGVHPRLWMPVAARLDGKCSLVAWESRGMWDSECPPDPSAVTVAHLARDATSIVSTLCLNGYGLIGFCAGAFVACEVLASGTYVPTQVMFISAPFRHGAQDTFVRFLRRVRERPGGWQAMVSFCEGFTPPELRDTLDETFRDGSRVLRFLDTLESYYNYVPRTGFVRHLPVYAVVAEGDPPVVKEANLDLEQGSHAGSRFYQIPGVHYSIITEPGALCPIIEECFCGVPLLPALRGQFRSHG